MSWGVSVWGYVCVGGGGGGGVSVGSPAIYILAINIQVTCVSCVMCDVYFGDNPVSSGGSRGAFSHRGVVFGDNFGKKDYDGT